MADTQSILKSEGFRKFIDGSAYAVFMADDEGRFVDLNHAAEELFGLPRSSIIGKKIVDFAAPVRERATEKMWDEFLVEGQQSGRFIISRPDGIDRVIQYSAVSNFHPGLHLSIAQDITEKISATN